MADETLNHIANDIATINRLIIYTIGTLSQLSQNVEEFIKNPDEEIVSKIEDNLSACLNTIDGVKSHLSQVASKIFDISDDSNGDVDIQAVDDGEGVRLQ